jgi:hypothetical protein
MKYEMIGGPLDGDIVNVLNPPQDLWIAGPITVCEMSIDELADVVNTEIPQGRYCHSNHYLGCYEWQGYS